MNELAKFCKSFKSNFSPKVRDSTEPVRCWSEKDLLDGKIVDAYVIIFRTAGCSWAHNSGCTICGYFNDSMWDRVSDEDLLKQFKIAMDHYNGEKFIKIFTSGSFFDEKEIKKGTRDEIINSLGEKTDKLSVESRPEYVTENILSEIKDILQSKTMEISIGLETANDFIRENAINKGFTFEDYKQAVQIIKKYNFKLKTYVLIKPPFITEKEAIEDCIETLNKIKDHSDTVSFNPTNVQRNTVVEYLWKRNQYRPPWLWSVVEILKTCKKTTDNIIKCDIAGGGRERGAHNCKNCNGIFLNAISEFSLSQDTDVFNDLDCECKENWLDQIDIEDLTFGSIVDFSRRLQ